MKLRTSRLWVQILLPTSEVNVKDKFIQALVDVCDTPDEVDEVFTLADISSFEERCNFLTEKSAKYFDLPSDGKVRYDFLKTAWTSSHSKFERKRKIAKEVILQIL